MNPIPGPFNVMSPTYAPPTFPEGARSALDGMGDRARLGSMAGAYQQLGMTHHPNWAAKGAALTPGVVRESPGENAARPAHTGGFPTPLPGSLVAPGAPLPLASGKPLQPPPDPRMFQPVPRNPLFGGVSPVPAGFQPPGSRPPVGNWLQALGGAPAYSAGPPQAITPELYRPTPTPGAKSKGGR